MKESAAMVPNILEQLFHLFKVAGMDFDTPVNAEADSGAICGRVFAATATSLVHETICSEDYYP